MPGRPNLSRNSDVRKTSACWCRGSLRKQKQGQLKFVAHPFIATQRCLQANSAQRQEESHYAKLDELHDSMSVARLTMKVRIAQKRLPVLSTFYLSTQLRRFHRSILRHAITVCFFAGGLFLHCSVVTARALPDSVENGSFLCFSFMAMRGRQDSLRPSCRAVGTTVISMFSV